MFMAFANLSARQYGIDVLRLTLPGTKGNWNNPWCPAIYIRCFLFVISGH